MVSHRGLSFLPSSPPPAFAGHPPSGWAGPDSFPAVPKRPSSIESGVSALFSRSPASYTPTRLPIGDSHPGCSQMLADSCPLAKGLGGFLLITLAERCTACTICRPLPPLAAAGHHRRPMRHRSRFAPPRGIGQGVIEACAHSRGIEGSASPARSCV
jgi:hypothetical protein